jgi:HemK-like putative methylase
MERPDLSILATDISPAALGVAKQNIDRYKAKVKLHTSDIFESMNKSAMGKYEVVLANLPYVPTQARRQPEIEFEPEVALFGGDDGLDLYRKLFKQLPDHLSDNGFAVIEASPTQHAQLVSIAKNYHIEPISEYIFVVHPV